MLLAAGSLASCSLDVEDPNASVTPFSLSSLAASEHTCGVASNRAVWCWGYAAYGQLGDGIVIAYEAHPVKVRSNVSFVSLAVGMLHTCGISVDSLAYCWGDNTFGAIGDSSATSSTATGFAGARRVPSVVTGGLKFASLTAGIAHTCGLTAGGQAYCWGNNDFGQVGAGSIGSHKAPTAVSGGITFQSIAAGDFFTCGLDMAGAAWCWGRNLSGRLGNGGTANSNTPVAVSGGLVFATIGSGGGGHACATTASGAAYCWGSNSDGQIGDSTTTDRPAPTLVASNLNFAHIAPGAVHTCALTTTGAAYCWGFNGAGAVGDATTTPRWTPVAVVGSLKFRAISSHQQTCGEGTDGIAYCWGRNQNGQLGDGGTFSRPGPAPVRSP
ncbi:MAG TPA: hypothetical protein VF483_11930 [Gemmatimonadaceae bacterium]